MIAITTHLILISIEEKDYRKVKCNYCGTLRVKRCMKIYMFLILYGGIFNFPLDVIFVVHASQLNDGVDYIRNYDDFLEYVKNMVIL